MKGIMDDKELWIKIKANDKKAYKFLFVKYSRRLLNYARRFVRDDKEVEDIVQSCFVRLWEKRATIEPISISSLLFTMVRNSCINYLKQKSLRNIHSVDYLENLSGKEVLYNIDFYPDAEASILYEELKTQIPVVLNKLPERSREIFMLSREEGLKNREIAEKLRISTTAVEKHISRSLIAFRKHFSEKYPVEIYGFISA